MAKSNSNSFLFFFRLAQWKSPRLDKWKVRGHASTNLPMLGIYISAVIPLFRKLGDRYSAKRNILEVRNCADIQLQYIDSSSYNTNNLYNYELIVPPEKADSIPVLMLRGLNHYSPYIGAIESAEQGVSR